MPMIVLSGYRSPAHIAGTDQFGVQVSHTLRHDPLLARPI